VTRVGPLSVWSPDVSAAFDDRAVGAVLADRAATAPAADAVAWDDNGELVRCAYEQLLGEATAFAHRLRALVPLGARVAVAAATSPDWLFLEYGAALAGAPLVPINPAFTDPEIEHILRSAEVAAAFADDTFRGTPLVERISALDAVAGRVRVHRLAEWRALPADGGSLPTVAGTDPFLVQFTSGTTGRPKGAVLSHRAAYNCAALTMARLEGTASDNWLNIMPMHHVGGSVSTVLAVLSVGAAVTLVPAFEPGHVLDMLRRTGATIIGAVPTMQAALLDHPDFATTDLRTLRIVQSGGSVVPPSLIRRSEQAFGAVIVNAYGQSESPNALMTSPTDDDVTKAETIGTPLPHREVRITGAGDGPARLGQVGELLMRSPMVMDGYIGVDEATARTTLTEEGWLHTGDLCSMDERGVVRIHGRVRDVIIRGGENIYPAEVEDVLLRHPGVADVAVIGLHDDRWGEVPVAAFRPADGISVDDAELDAFCREQLASFKVPRRWLRVAELPLTASGKVKKYALRAQLEEEEHV
jgi:fatty-acyl-CoA synthase